MRHFEKQNNFLLMFPTLTSVVFQTSQYYLSPPLWQENEKKIFFDIKTSRKRYSLTSRHQEKDILWPKLCFRLRNIIFLLLFDKKRKGYSFQFLSTSDLVRFEFAVVETSCFFLVLIHLHWNLGTIVTPQMSAKSQNSWFLFFFILKPTLDERR